MSNTHTGSGSARRHAQSVINALRRGAEDEQSLHHADLSHGDLRELAPKIHCDFNHADLSHADLRGAIIADAIFDRADLSHADMASAILSGSSLIAADLRGVDAAGADLSGCDLRSANLFHGVFRNANFAHSRMSKVTLQAADLTRANLDECDLTGAILSGCTFSGASLRNACLDYADLRDADLRDADLSGASLAHADLREANIPAQVEAGDEIDPSLSPSERGLITKHIPYKRMTAARKALADEGSKWSADAHLDALVSNNPNWPLVPLVGTDDEIAEAELIRERSIIAYSRMWKEPYGINDTQRIPLSSLMTIYNSQPNARWWIDNRDAPEWHFYRLRQASVRAARSAGDIHPPTPAPANDVVVEAYRLSNGNLKATQWMTGLNQATVRRIVMEAGLHKRTPYGEAVAKLAEEGLSAVEIAEKIGRDINFVRLYMPFHRGRVDVAPDELSDNGLACRRRRRTQQHPQGDNDKSKEDDKQ